MPLSQVNPDAYQALLQAKCDRTSELLKAASGNVLVFKTDSALPDALAAQARVTGRVVQLAANDAQDIEHHLATLREAGVEVQDIEIRRADLEDVFLNVMAAAAAAEETAGAAPQPRGYA